MIRRTTALTPILSTFVFISIILTILCSAASGVPSGPDLVITDLTGQQTGSPGYPYEGTITLKNTGDQTSGITSVYLFLKNSGEPTLNATISAVPLDPVRPDQTITLSYVGTIENQLATGEYSLYGYIKGTGQHNPEKPGSIARLSSPVTIFEKTLPERSSFEQDIIAKIRDDTNKNRAAKGLNLLVWDDDLAEIARRYAHELSESGHLSHTSKNGSGPAERAEEFGYPTTKEIEGGVRIGISENLAYIGTGMVSGIGYVDPTNSTVIASALMNGWMNSPGHRKNILDPLADRFGVGLFWNGEYYYAVTEFW